MTGISNARGGRFDDRQAQPATDWFEMALGDEAATRIEASTIQGARGDRADAATIRGFENSSRLSGAFIATGDVLGSREVGGVTPVAPGVGLRSGEQPGDIVAPSQAIDGRISDNAGLFEAHANLVALNGNQAPLAGSHTVNMLTRQVTAPITGRGQTTTSDPLASSEWHKEHIDLAALGGRYNGAGVRVAVVDDGIQASHRDLAANYRTANEVIVNGVRLSGSVGAGEHGTAVAGLIAGVSGNNLGGSGVASGAQIAGVDVLGNGNAGGMNLIASYRDLARVADIANNSWGWIDAFADGVQTIFGRNFVDAMTHVTANGRGGLGTIQVKSGGNDWWTDNRSVNATMQSVSRHTIDVGAIDDYGNRAIYGSVGSALLVSAPSSGGSRGLTTTDMTGAAGYDPGDFTSSFGGTSGAAPIVSGLVALMLQANPGLGWRDVQDILAFTADHSTSNAVTGGTANSPTAIFGWQINRADNVNNGGAHYSLDVGFGRVDAHEAVRWAELWSRMNGSADTSANEQNANVSATWNAAIADGATFTRTMRIGTDLEMDSAQVTITMSHGNANGLRIELVSPEGTTIQVFSPMTPVRSVNGWQWTFAAEGFRGEMSAGDWTLRITDTRAGDRRAGTITSARLDVYGDAGSANDVYHITDEFGKMARLDVNRQLLTDTDGGIDWINMAGVKGNAFIDLNPGVWGRLDNGPTFRIAAGTVIENAAAGDGNDTLVGNDAANLLLGMRGDDILIGGRNADTLEGGEGRDAASYATSDVAVTVDLTRAVQAGSAHVVGDVLIGIENIIGSSFDDLLVGDAGANVLIGNSGCDTLMGGAGADTLDGGGFQDMASYANSAAGVVIDMRQAVQSGGDAQGDVFISIEGVIGSAFADRITTGNATTDTGLRYTVNGGGGDDIITAGSSVGILAFGEAGNDTLIGGAGMDTLDGGNGADVLDGGAQDDVLNGGAGDDVLVGGAGNDILNGGAGNDRFTFEVGTDIMDGGDGIDTIDMSTRGAATIIDLTNGGVADALNLMLDNEAVRNVENVIGTAFNDIIISSTVGGRLEGRDGDDTLRAGSTASETLDGGLGFDTVSYVHSTAGVNVTVGGQLRGGFAEGDIMISIEAFIGSRLSDTLTGSAGNDRLFGDAGADMVSGGTGDDNIGGGNGDDTLTGGTGRDVFDFSRLGGQLTGGRDVITDFSRAEGDRIDLRGTAASMAALQISTIGSDVLVNFREGSFVVAGFAGQQLQASDFIFT